MADTIGHLLFTIGGGYKSTAPDDQPEIWQTNCRLTVSHDVLPPVGTLEATYSVVEDEQTVTTADYTITSNWRLEGGINDFDPVSWMVDFGLPAAQAWFNCDAISALAQGFFLKAAFVGVDGKQVPPAGFAQGTPVTLTWNTDSRPNGNGSSNTLPLQCSVVASHRTSQTGKKGRGRQFLPAIDQNSIDASGRLSSSAQTSILNAQVAFLEALSYADAPRTIVRPAVISSSTSGASPTLNKYATINGVRVGNVVDTQRRRRNKLVEAYASGDVSY